MAQTAAPYASGLVFLILGGLVIGQAMQRCRLHLRLALLIVRRTGARADRVVGGLMLATAALSMWISNTATAAMMVPIGVSIASMAAERDPAGAARLGPALMLGVAFGANIGGMATLIGTPPNAVVAGYLEQAHGVRIGFADWMALGLPLSLALLWLAWLSLTRLSFPLRGAALAGVGAMAAAEAAALGPPRPAERRVAAVFVLAVAGWLFRPQLSALLPPGAELSDAGIAMLAAVALFMAPDGERPGRFLMDWQATRDLPWGVLVLVGGGLSLGAAIDGSGLAAWIGAGFAGLAAAPLAVAILAVAAATMAVSHIASNTATAAALAPVVAALALSIGAAPAALGVPMALAASASFMLPVATPPNAIAHGTGLVDTAAMARAGALVSLAALGLILLAGLAVAASGLGAAAG
jgi:sodium-dependent dicarboxylate transporter 2/3/5